MHPRNLCAPAVMACALVACGSSADAGHTAEDRGAPVAASVFVGARRSAPGALSRERKVAPRAPCVTVSAANRSRIRPLPPKWMWRSPGSIPKQLEFKWIRVLVAHGGVRY